MAVCYDTEDWIRATRGRNHRFLATDEEVLYLLRSALPENYAPYTIIAYDNVKIGDRYRHIVEETETSEFLLLRERGFLDYFIRSRAISPSIDLSDRRFIDVFLFVNGLVNLGHGSIIRAPNLGWTPSDFGLVNKIAHRRTGEMVTHHDYEKIFFALRRAVKKMARYKTMRVRPSGEEIEERHIHMTEGFVAKLRSGEIESAYYPGHPL